MRMTAQRRARTRLRGASARLRALAPRAYVGADEGTLLDEPARPIPGATMARRRKWRASRSATSTPSIRRHCASAVFAPFPCASFCPIWLRFSRFAWASPRFVLRSRVNSRSPSSPSSSPPFWTDSTVASPARCAARRALARSSISLADFVDFGVAPALILDFWGLHEIKNLGWFAALVFAIAAALRLARFNVMAEEPDRPAWRDHFFTGMPAPAGAIVGLLPLYLSLSIFEAPHGRFMVWLYIAYVLVIALLMASRIPHFSGKKIGRVPRDYVIVVLFGVVAGLLLLATFPMEDADFLRRGLSGDDFLCDPPVQGL